MNITQFENIVEQYPEHIALVDHTNRQYTYLELNQKANQLAKYLVNQNFVNGGSFVGITDSDKINSVICQIAVMKVGVTYVPLSDDMPVSQLDKIISHANIDCILLTESATSLAKLGKEIKKLDVRAVLDSKTQNQDKNIATHTTSKKTNPAYVLYTSGSTSEPKGVIQTQIGIVNQIQNYTRDSSITQDDRVLQLATHTHDQSVVDIYGALLNGATLHLLPSKKMLEPAFMQDYLQKNAISIFSSIPSIFSLIFNNLNLQKHPLPKLRIITIGGEEVNLVHAKQFQTFCPKHAVLIAGYGASECSWICGFTVDHDMQLDAMSTLPLGKPTEGLSVKIDHCTFENAPSKGELMISGSCVSPGYLKNEIATSKAFETDGHGRTWYRTGDIVSMNTNGNLCFEGRMKWHEKIRGHRVNLRDVEQVILQLYQCKEVVVLASGKGINKTLVAFIADIPDNLDKLTSKNMLKKRLQDHELPSKIIFLEALPKLSNQKIDRNSLRHQLEKGKITVREKDNDNKNNDNKQDLIQKLERIWCDSMEILPVNLNNNDGFLDLGGNSIKAAEIKSKVEKAVTNTLDVKIELSLLDLFKNMTFKALIKSVLLKSSDALHQSRLKQFKTRANHPDAKLLQGIHQCDFIHKQYNLLFLPKQIGLEMNFSAMQLMALYYSKKYNIYITPCKRPYQIAGKICKFVDDPDLPSQFGITFPNVSSREAHPTAAIIYISRDKKIAHIFISDSVYSTKEHLLLIQKHITINKIHGYKLRIYLDRYGRQIDFVSCNVDAILFLKNSLLLDDFMENVKNSIQMFNGNYYFSSPPDGLKTYQRSMAKLRLDRPLKNGTNLATFFNNNLKPTDAYIVRGPSNRTKYKIHVNHYVYSKSYKFFAIITENALLNAVYRNEHQHIPQIIKRNPKLLEHKKTGAAHPAIIRAANKTHIESALILLYNDVELNDFIIDILKHYKGKMLKYMTEGDTLHFSCQESNNYLLKTLDKDSSLGQVFYAKRSKYERSINKGSLKKVIDILKTRGYTIERICEAVPNLQKPALTHQCITK